MIKKLKQIWYYAKVIYRGDPIRTWRKVDGKYCCDGDCGRWSLHGVCTCGISHLLKPTDGRFRKLDRDNASWHREYQTQDVMRQIEFEHGCRHGTPWNDKCQQCETALDKVLEGWDND